MKFLTTEKSTQGLFVVLDLKGKVVPRFVGMKEVEKGFCKITKIEAKMQESLGELIEFEEEEGETIQQKGAKALNYDIFYPKKMRLLSQIRTHHLQFLLLEVQTIWRHHHKYDTIHKMFQCSDQSKENLFHIS